MDKSHPGRVWAKISKADMLFLTNIAREGRVISTYQDALAKSLIQQAVTELLDDEHDFITRVTLWDGKRNSDAPGRTAHMVELAESAGNVYFSNIDLSKIFK